jgi:hypothetical protein
MNIPEKCKFIGFRKKSGFGRFFFMALGFYIFPLFMNSNCGRPVVKEVELCDLFRSDGSCSEPVDSRREFRIPIPKNKNIRTWEDFSHYLYFTVRETPGLIVRFDRQFSDSERNDLRENCVGVYELFGKFHHMEGKEVGKNWVGGFQYLGTILEEEAKSRSIWDRDLDLGDLFPIQGDLGFQCFQSRNFSSLSIRIPVVWDLDWESSRQTEELKNRKQK